MQEVLWRNTCLEHLVVLRDHSACVALGFRFYQRRSTVILHSRKIQDDQGS